ncbi:phosphate transport system permease protein PstA [Candidatus Pelagibacter sp. IMCC9063]|uniref:phosphate ABC transporter permease PstA n=1 Tax=Pelagibacter sp. (strain IMCC9063) TaxID=1002672 RepID=UPI00020465C6|nr:phosphate ABC transporter permease PstA [Candidatus Pelagibacter sp. IMCC9063]AEA80673.1 phosphate transport system permease protein PstA [Candidatus Pelagibacter sp. IMCC9063]|tara:strand:+ start:1209 stop:2471 length:1263 start_codon:yes stop_codon:yes gene_type:complete
MTKEQRLKKRYSAEKRFKAYGIISVCAALLFVGILVFKVFSEGSGAFVKTAIQLELDLSKEKLNLPEKPSKEDFENIDFYDFAQQHILKIYPAITTKEKKELLTLFSSDFEYEVKDFILSNKNLIGQKVFFKITAASDLDQMHKGNYTRDIPEERRKVSNFQLTIYDFLLKENKISKIFNNYLFSNGDSRNPEIAGIGGAMLGSFFSIIVCLIISFPIALLAAVYLEEFAPKNAFTDFIEININNLAAVPSIVFGLLGLGILLNVFELPRSTSLVGGITLALMTLPRIIIPCRASLKAVPPSIREGALAVGASKVQSVMHHVVPLAMPGTLSGTIIGLAQALGETAPLLLIGMVAFVVQVPGTPMDPSSSLPVQVYLWSESAERGFVEKTSATIMMLLGFLIAMNSIAVYARQKFEKKWI